MSKRYSQILTNDAKKKQSRNVSKLGFKYFSSLGTTTIDSTTTLGVRSVSVTSHFPPDPINWDSQLTFLWFDEDIDGLGIGSDGVVTGNINATSQLATGSYNKIIVPVILTSNRSILGIKSSSDIYVDPIRTNWIKWSNIGYLDFTIGKDNIAGERPLDWKGQIYAIKKLTNKVIVYGENGVSVLIPSGNTYGLNTIYRVGLKTRNAITGNDAVHYFIDKRGQLWRFGETLERLDYSEYLSTMNNNLVMLFDNYNNLVYICDGGAGYVFNPLMGSFGTCQNNITGIAEQNGNFYVVSSGTIIKPFFEICTDIYDFGTRNYKTINFVDIDAEQSSQLNMAIDYKRGINDNFASTPWVDVPSNGRVFIRAFGRDFKFRLRATSSGTAWAAIGSLSIYGDIYN